MRIFLIILLSLLFSPTALSQSELDSELELRTQRLNTIATDLKSEEADLIAIRDLLRNFQQETDQQTAPLREKLKEVLTDIESLGPVSESDEVVESPAILEERKRLNQELALLNGVLRKSDLNSTEAERLLKEVARLRQDQFSSTIFARSPSLFTTDIWLGAFAQIKNDFLTFKDSIEKDLLEKQNFSSNWTTNLSLAFAITLALVCFIPIRNYLRRLINRRLENVEALGSRKVLVLAAYTMARLLPALIGGYIFYEALRYLGFIPVESEAFARTLWIGFVALVMVDATVTGSIAPNAPKWRILHISDAQAFQLRTLVFIASFTIVGELIVLKALSLSNDIESVITLIRASTTLILSAVLFGLTRASIWKSKEPKIKAENEVESRPLFNGSRIRFGGTLIAGISMIACLVSYLNLGHYLTTRAFYLAALAAIIWVLRSVLGEVIRLFDKRYTEAAEGKHSRESVLFYWIGLIIDSVAFLIFIPPALVLLGADWADVRDGVIDSFIGIKIGTFNFSILKIVTAITFFVILLSITHFIQRFAETRVFPRSRINIGVQNSLKTLIGYVGLIIAFLVGLSTLGFDLSNFALIAGALSIGIGFGLQSIVSNFVSGLILLFERPIKVGDWIVTNSGEGFVKKISVRSTEIETFEKASVLIPNAELVSGAVTNWTHKDKIGRITIAVGVSYNSDPDQVIAILESVAKENPNILNTPKPFIYFSDFADSSLNFELRCFTNDVKQRIFIGSALRLEIFKKFREAGIEIPFPQRDVHIKSTSET